MMVGISRFVVVAAIAALAMVGGSTAAWAACPDASPNFTPDFTSGPNCLALNPTQGTTPQFVATGEPSHTLLRLTTDTQSQVGSAWFNTQQPVAGGFSTTFRFQFTRGGEHTPADGIAFVIQNSSVTALGQGGGSIGYADGGLPCNNGLTPPPCGGIPNSLAVEFDTFNNASATGDPNANHISVQSCGTQPNSPAHGPNDLNFPLCQIGTVATPSITLSDGAVHTVVISYAPPACTGECSGVLTVILDGSNVLTTSVTLENELVLSEGGTAWVGFTSATGAAFENHDILSWTFSPQAQSATITAGGPAAVLKFQGGPANNAYDYNAQLLVHDGGLTSATVQVQPILIDEESCEQLVDANKAFGHAQCFVFQNADGKGTASAVLYELTCPGLNAEGSCDQDSASKKFFADLGTDFVFQKSDNEGFQLLNSTFGPYAGWLKGNGGVPGHPCAPNPDGVTPLFQSNQISSFSVTGDPTGITKGGARPGGSCWVATYATGGEAPPGIKITSPTFFTTYKQSLTTQGSAVYACSNPKTSKDPNNSPVGPYLTVASCTQSQAPNLHNSSSCSANVGGVITCNGTFDVSVKGLHVFQVTAKDSGGNVNVNFVVYIVK